MTAAATGYEPLREPLTFETLGQLAFFLFGPIHPAFEVRSLPEVAAGLGVSISTVNRWRAMGMPGKPGAWNIQVINRWSLSPGGPRESARYINAVLAHAQGRAGE